LATCKTAHIVTNNQIRVALRNEVTPRFEHLLLVTELEDVGTGNVNAAVESKDIADEGL
jgi:hypothetical protein